MTSIPTHIYRGTKDSAEAGDTATQHNVSPSEAQAWKGVQGGGQMGRRG